jgi:hypothetical protein
MQVAGFLFYTRATRDAGLPSFMAHPDEFFAFLWLRLCRAVSLRFACSEATNEPRRREERRDRCARFALDGWISNVTVVR